MISQYRRALEELGAVFDRLDDAGVEAALDVIEKAPRIAVYGSGREGLQIKGFAMRLFHLGRNVAVVGDMTTFAVGKGDLLIVTAGPGALPIAETLMEVARASGATTMLITAQPEGPAAEKADVVLTIPAQTMASDQGPDTSVLPMGSQFEGAQYVLFEVMILRLRERLAVTPEDMRANHTNLE